MINRTLDELSRFLRDDLGWRKKENHVFHSLVRDTAATKKQAVLRGAIATLYAHWEGFVKTACKAYLAFVANRRLPHNQLTVPLLGLAFRLRLKATEEIPRLDSHTEFATWVLKEWEGRAKLPDPDEVIETSNLNSNVFKSYILALGLPYVDDYQLAEKPVIDVLVHLRNHLAHGEWQVVNETEYDELHVWISKLMSILCDEIENAILTQSYLRRMPQLT